MSPKRKLILLLTPSAMSLLLGISISIVMMVVSSLAFAQHNGRFGNFNLSTYVTSTGITTTGSLIKSFFSNLKFNTLFSILFWVLVGFITYNVVYVFRSSVDESVTFVQRFHYVHARPSYMRRQVALRIALLLVALVLWIAFALLFSWVILPSVLNLVNKTITNRQSGFYLILGFIIILLVTHLAAILMRFTLLKVRVSGADKA